MVEQWTFNPCVVGSIPTQPTALLRWGWVVNERTTRISPLDTKYVVPKELHMDRDHQKMMADTDRENKQQVSNGEGVPLSPWFTILLVAFGAIIIWLVAANVLS